jgi:DNA-binding transcriptional LysR family regulator
VNFNNLKYFLTIAEEGNISKAADRLHVSQQSLSEQLHKMEEELGVRLVIRSRPTSLTLAGKVFARTATQLLVSYNEMLDEIAQIAQIDKSKITLAIPSTETPPFLPGLLAEFFTQYPNLEVKIIRINPIDAAKYSADFDLFFSVLPLATDLEHITVFDKDSYVVAFVTELAERVYGDEWPRIEAELLEKRDLGLLRDMPFVLLRNKLEQVVLGQKMIFEDAGFEPKVAFVSDNGELNYNMCILGSGALVATREYCRRRFKSDIGEPSRVRLFPINTNLDPVVIALSHRKGKRLSKADQCFIKTAKQYLANK